MEDLEKKIKEKELEIAEYRACMKRLGNFRWQHYMVERLEEKLSSLEELKKRRP